MARILSIAASSVARASGLAGFEKPMWLSDTWMKEKLASAAFAEPMRREEGTPPATVQTIPLPAQSMHFRVCRRSSPPSAPVIIAASSKAREAPDGRETRG